VYHDAAVYINGQKVGVHNNSSYTAFSFEISKFLHFGPENKLVVCSDNSFSDTNLPYKRSFDWAGDGGITRTVSLHVAERPSVKYLHVTPKFDQVTFSGRALVELRLNEEDVSAAELRIVCKERKSQKVVYQEGWG
jgi:beta-galactosidase